MANLVKLMLDSGAFSSWNRGGGMLNVAEYIKYIKDHEPLLWAYVGMDVIPGEFGKMRTREQLEASAKGGYKNHQQMKDAGLKPIPVFHQGERFEWLEKYLKDGDEYIGIGSAKDYPASEQAKWLDEIFTVLTDAQGRPLVKIHGFGITKVAFLVRYPWYSVDSTTWALNPGYGNIFVPSLSQGKPDYVNPSQVHISGVQTRWMMKSTPNRFETFGPIMQDWIVKYLNEHVGVTVAEARYFTEMRRLVTLTYFTELASHLPERRFKQHQRSSLKPLQKRKPVDLGPELNIMFATFINNAEFSELLLRRNATTRLLSYYETREYTTEQLRTYVEKGTLAPRRRRIPKPDWSNKDYLNYRRRKFIERERIAGAQDGTEVVT